MNQTKFTKAVYIGTANGEKEYLAAPSWDCGWYWGFGYLQNKNIHHHVDTIDRNSNLFDALQRYYGDSLVIKDLWTFCELMATFYTLKEAAEVLGRGGAHYTSNLCAEIIRNEAEAKRINEVVMPALFDEIYKLFPTEARKRG